MIDTVGTFPFGQPIQRVVQTDRSPKRVFVLGVYASAVHARWVCPQGKTIIRALGVGRSNAWLCDLVPYSCMNDGQRRAIDRSYDPKAEKLGLPSVNWPQVPSRLTDEPRREAILAELRESQAEILVTLGDMPLKWFAKE